MSPPKFEILAYESTPLGMLCLRRRELLSEPGTVVTEVTRFIALELDFRREADSTERLRKTLRAMDDVVVVPEVFRRFCGDNVIEFPETCDGGNTTPGDGCSAICEIETPPVAVPGLGALGLIVLMTGAGGFLVRRARDAVA